MAMPVYMTVEGKVQSTIEGACTRLGHEGHIEVEAIGHLIEMPFDKSRGHHLARRVHFPVKVLKMIDRSSPALMKAMVDHEMLTVELMWYRQEATTAKEEHFYTTTLEEATIVAVETMMPNQFEKDNKSVPHLEEVSFAYKGIRWNYIPESLEVTDHHDAAAK